MEMENVYSRISHPKMRQAIDFARRYKNALIFLSGFIFDALTIKRIDALADLAIQIVYLLFLTVILIYQHRYHKNFWRPGKWMSKIWPYNVEALHFFYGGLLSAYVILYLKSTSGARALVFLGLLIFLLIFNEMPQVRRFGYRLRLGLYAFCVSSFLIYFVPILLRQMSWWTFLLSLVLSGLIVWGVAGRLSRGEENPKKVRRVLFVPAGALFAIIIALYFMKLIPPVPLSVQFQGIYHQVERVGDKFEMTYPKPPWYRFWKDSSVPFVARPEDEIHYFVRVFAPSKFKHEVQIRWSLFNPKKEAFEATDQIPLPVVGGREKGFRGYVSKKNFQEGTYRVAALTEDGRTIGALEFEVKWDDKGKERQWEKFRM